MRARTGQHQDLHIDGVRITRRQIIAGAASVALAAALPVDLTAQPALPAISEAEFFRLSQAVTGHSDIGVTTASRMLAAMHASDPLISVRLSRLSSLLTQGQDPEGLLLAAEQVGLADLVHSLVSFWYTGTVGADDNPKVVAYFGALMYRTVSDGLPVPTYCSQSGIWWEGEPPSVGVDPPSKQPGNIAP